MGTIFWKLIILRAVWFLLAAVCLVVALLIIAQHVSGGETGTNYTTTITSKTAIPDASAGDPVCRVGVDPAGAPEKSDGPTRVLSTTPCSSLPLAGDRIELTFIDSGRTLPAGEQLPESERTPLWVAGVLGAAMLGFIALFVLASRAFNRALDEVGPAPERGPAN